MSDEVKADATQVDATPQPPQAGQPAPDTTPQAGGRLDADKLTKELEDARKEAAKYRTERKTLAEQLEQFKAELDKLQTAQLSEQEKKDKEYQRAQAKAADLEAKLAETAKRNQELQARTLVQAAAVPLGIVDPETVYLLLREQGKLEPDEAGALDAKRVTEALRDLLKAKPYLLGTPTTSAANPAKTDPSVQQETVEARRARLMGGGDNIFDAERARKRGGGVVWGDRGFGSS